jgi:dihydroorotase
MDIIRVGVAGVKYYPHGLTTNSEHGLDASSGFQSVYHLLAKMQELGLVLNIHGEVASSHEMVLIFHFFKY